ncbi:MAG TPA: hypothetical protein VF322_00550 [Gammaproteobacteria bacterium]
MVRGVLGVVIGGIVWMPVFFILAWLPASVWPDYARSGATWFDAGVYTFTASMSVLNAVLWLVASIVAGWLAALVARRREAAWALAVLVMLYMCFNHLYYFWDRFPWWYNLVVALPSGPAVLLGGRLARRWSRLGRRAAAAAPVTDERG